MKHTTRLLTAFAFCAALCNALRAAPLASETPVRASPDSSSPVLVTLPAGADPDPATAASTVALPEGWQAIAITASFDAWVRDSDLNKELDVKPGSTLRAAPANDAEATGTMVAGDVTELRGIQGKWVQMRITKKTTGYINTGASAAGTPEQPATDTAAAAAPEQQPETPVPYAPGQTDAPAVQQLLSVSSAVSVPAPPSQTSPVPADAGRAHAAANAAVPRTFEGTFASTRRAFIPRRPYDFQLTAPDGTRLAYLDLGKLSATRQPESYIGRTVIVNGPIAGIPNTQDIVIKVETLQAK